MMETVFLDLNNMRYKWDNIGNGKTKISTTNIDTSDISIGIISERSILKLKLNITALFLDLGETLVTHDDTSGKFIEFPETDIILKNLKENGIEIGIISDGSRSQLNNLLANPLLLNRFKVIVM
jgi:predicted HAD superfamily phosphohydrolase YqeG